MAFADCAVECAEYRRKKNEKEKEKEKKQKNNNGVSILPSQLR
jgi:hypothetical protein